MNFNCVFPSCNYQRNGIEEKEFLDHLKDKHQHELTDIAKKEKMPISMVEMITISNSKVFINT